MMYSVLASGSKGNCTYLEFNNIKILVDLGPTAKYINEKLKELSQTSNDINYIFITHLHNDHIYSLDSFIRKGTATFVLTESIYQALKTKPKNYVIIKNEITIDQITVKNIKLSHDVSDSNGYIFNFKNKTIAYITDTGYINSSHHEILTNCDSYIMESNHDVTMLMNSKRPYQEKMRTLGDKGHLSNEACCGYLAKFIGPKTKSITLIHLSEENNNEALIKEGMNKIIYNKKIDVIISKQKERTKQVKV